MKGCALTIDALNEQFARQDQIRFESGPHRLTRIRLAGQGSQATVLLHGAHVTEFRPAGQQPVLWMSHKSWFAAGKPVRGGVPVCWPWFSGDGPTPDAPKHGIARLVNWRVRSTDGLPDGRAQVVLVLEPADLNAEQRALWPHAFELTHTVTVGRELTMALTTRNTGPSPFTITEALHSYLAVSDIRQVQLLGLENARYLDTVGEHAWRQQGRQPITFTGETDRDFLDNAAECLISDAGWGRRIAIAKTGSRSTVVWNPWSAKAGRMPDFGDAEWPGMLCVETANVRDANAVTIPPGREHTLEARVIVR